MNEHNNNKSIMNHLNYFTLEETHDVTMILNSNFYCILDDKQTNQQIIYEMNFTIFI